MVDFVIDGHMISHMSKHLQRARGSCNFYSAGYQAGV